MTVPLSTELQQALAASHGSAVYLTDSATNSSYVLVPAAAYERLRDLIVDDSEPEPSEFLPLAHQAFADDWNAPGMEAYDQLAPKKSP